MGGGADHDWRRLLKGGFAFESAPFAAHPLDKRRAVKALALAFAQGVSSEEILAEARRHLQNVYSPHAEAAVAEQIDRVNDFLRAQKPGNRFRRLWLVFWNSTEVPVIRSVDHVVQAFDPRSSGSRIENFLTDFYSSSEYSVREKAYFSTRKKKNPYTAMPIIDSSHRLKGYHCGHNPWLEARLCENLIVEELDDGKSRVHWSKDSATGL